METDLRNETASPAEVNQAQLLNDLIDKGILDRTKVEEADLVDLGEMIIRYYEDIADYKLPDDTGKVHELPEKVVKKLKTLFGDREKRPEEEVEKVVESTREIIEFLKMRTGLPISGAIVHGSRMDIEKRPRTDSDLDLCLFIDQQDFDKRRVEMLIWQVWIKELKLPYKVKINEVYDRDNFLSEVDINTDKSNYVPFWGWNPESFRFVGKMKFGYKELTDDEVTAYLKAKLSSDEMQRRRKWKVKFAESEIERFMKMETTFL